MEVRPRLRAAGFGAGDDCCTGKAISRATGTNVEVETLKILVIFSGAGLLVSLVAAMIYGQAFNAALF